MSRGIQHDLHTFATGLIRRRGGLVDWPSPGEAGTAVLTPELAAELHAGEELVPLTGEANGEGICVNLATSFLETAGHLLEGVPRVAALRLPDAYLKRGPLDDALGRAFSWLNAKVVIRETRAVEIEYHTWSFHATLRSEDRWESTVAVTVNSQSGAAVSFPDPLRRWDFEPGVSGGIPAQDTYRQAAAEARRNLLSTASGFFARMDSRLERDCQRLRAYYGALLRQAVAPKSRRQKPAAPEEIESKKRAVSLELQRKLKELESRYAMQGTLQPIVLVRTAVPVLAVILRVHRKSARRLHTIYWNSLSKTFEPLSCTACGRGSFAVAFTNDDVDPRCRACAGRT